ncbi:hypothetical protein ARMGADRAFT_443842 [Armillaria gallica]|uniref:Uncharacterized protein n=1 Tax=Armillaria gallica TaxID=47427 RepID=A0A2H3DHQ2_ARMGA|nr:hypothetical protein ARMGADRAFT_443842 [Armillaria gallica]
MPMLKDFCAPPFHCRFEFSDALRQLLEAGTLPRHPSSSNIFPGTQLYAQLQHSSCGTELLYHAAELDSVVSWLNFLMDSSKVCPRGYHFANELSYDGVYWSLPTRPHAVLGQSDIISSTLRVLRNFLIKLDVYNSGVTFFELCEVMMYIMFITSSFTSPSGIPRAR